MDDVFLGFDPIWMRISFIHGSSLDDPHPKRCRESLRAFNSWNQGAFEGSLPT